MTHRVAIRTDAYPRIGGGHLSRCLAIGAALRDRGDDVVVVCAAVDGTPWDAGRAAGIAVLPLESSLAADAVAFLATVRAHFDADADLVIVDHYGLGEAWESRVRERGPRVLVIDDLADRPHDCDWLLDSNLVVGGRGAAIARYVGRTPPDCQLLLGPRYALIRSEIVRRCGRPREEVASPARILVSMGATDPEASTVKIVHALRSLDTTAYHADVVVGASHPQLGAIQAAIDDDPRLLLHVQPADYVALLADADVAVGAGGVSALERCLAGVASVVLSIADNQIGPARGLAEAGAALYLGRASEVSPAAVAGAMALLIGAPELRVGMNRKGRDLVDGQGIERIARLLAGRERVGVRLAHARDADMIFAWRNHPSTRTHIFDPRPLELDAHRAWVAARARDPECVLLIGSDAEGRDFGVLRYDLEGSMARVSVYLDPQRTGGGLGAALLRAGSAFVSERHPEVELLEAEIVPANAASTGAFERAGYTLHHHVFRHAQLRS